ncbi:DNA-binding transcriptional regulator, XRE-family HTH domain [Zunongwangia mangrovi]|uniref:DNA-binding transcriptional regulator, XRE-family HTH domain n=1 Tax=Zunongwangia mangrovi TaxID=1334022 RepID=A0A1I1GCP7_9FLAO|nr:helix-turn-helix transcriptional regulator [Zunongwangia mangrovi]SFC06900.1 DNA-binding transcriptional regulator, XRE-family HTH domain [Zunongwangia mangrovi]
MVNTKEFTNRLREIIEYYDLSASSFADKIEVGRSSISHLLSGRNKPSLEFVMKIVKTFPEVELYWLLNGKGTFPKTEEYTVGKNANPKVSGSKLESASKNSEDDLFSSSSESKTEDKSLVNLPNRKDKKIAKVIIFYEDGTFDAFEN